MTTGAMPPGHRSLGLHGITFVHRFSHPGRSNSFWAHQEYPPNITSFPLLASSLNQSSNETLYALRPSALNPNPKDPLIFQVEVANARWGKAYPHRSIPAAETRPKGWPDCYGFSAKGSASPVLRRVARRPVLELACHLLQSGSAQAWPSFVFIIGPG